MGEKPDPRRRVPEAQSIVTRRIVGRSFASSYLARDAAASLFIPNDFRDQAARVTLARAAAQRRIAPALAEVLRAQQARLPASPARQANLDALLGGDCAVVVSGQQVGLFLGPLYTFYKAASAIAAARTIEREAGVRCVPLFWLQTEDHDFAEIASARGISPQVVALAWHLAQSPHVIPIPGSSRPETILDSVTAVDVELTPEELDRLNAA